MEFADLQEGNAMVPSTSLIFDTLGRAHSKSV